MYYQKENIGGVYDFRCRIHDNFIIKRHIHEYSEILYCRQGSCKISINGKELDLNTGEFVFIPPNCAHKYDCMDVNVICAVFSNDFIPLFFKLTKGKKPMIEAYESKELKDVFEKLPETDKANLTLISAYLNLICSKVIECGKFEKTSPGDGMLYQKVISYISENFKNDVSLKKIAKELGYNEKYLSSAMHSLTGIHFSDFIAMYRVEYAKELLAKRRELSIVEIALESGFSAANTFNRQFKKITEMSPSEYKRHHSIV